MVLHCPFCDFTTETLSKMAQHVQAKHNSSSCPVCGVSFKYLPLHCREMARFDLLHATLYYLLGTRFNKGKRKYARIAEWVLERRKFRVQRMFVDGGMVVETEFALILFPKKTRNTSLPKDVAEALIGRIGEDTTVMSIINTAREEYGIEGLETPHAGILKSLALLRF